MIYRSVGTGVVSYNVTTIMTIRPKAYQIIIVFVQRVKRVMNDKFSISKVMFKDHTCRQIFVWMMNCNSPLNMFGYGMITWGCSTNVILIYKLYFRKCACFHLNIMNSNAMPLCCCTCTRTCICWETTLSSDVDCQSLTFYQLNVNFDWVYEFNFIHYCTKGNSSNQLFPHIKQSKAIVYIV